MNNLWFLWVLLSVLWIALGEYIAHRWVMHRGVLGRNAWWREHAVEHHGHNRNDVGIDLSWPTVLLVASPMLLGCIVLGWQWALFVVGESMFYAWLWTSLHSAYHEVGCEWIKRWSYYDQWKHHHMLHHDYPNKNYGAVCIWTDYAFGTKARS